MLLIFLSLMIWAVQDPDVGALAEAGDIEGLAQAFAAGADLERSSMGAPPVHRAAAAGRTETVAWLIERGISVDAVDAFDHTPSMRAAEGGHLDLLRYLHERGADFDRTDELGRTALLCAIDAERAAVVRYLIEEVEVNILRRDAYGRDALDYGMELKDPALRDFVAQRVRAAYVAAPYLTAEGKRKMTREETLTLLEEGMLTKKVADRVRTALASDQPLPEIPLRKSSPGGKRLTRETLLEQYEAEELPEVMMRVVTEALENGTPLPIPPPLEMKPEALAALSREAIAAGRVLRDLTTDKPIDLTRYRGKVLLLDFWATWCKPCIAALPDLRRFHARYENEPFRLLSITVDEDVAAARTMARRKNMVWDNARDPSAGPLARELFATPGMPTFIVIDADGRKRLHVPGFSREIMRALEEAIEDALDDARTRPSEPGR